MHLTLSRSDSVPLYRQIERQIRAQIASGTLQPGDRLPTHRSLARSCGVNRSTVVTAYQELQSARLIQSHVGRGTVVSSCVSDGLYGTGAPPSWDSYVQSGMARWNYRLQNEVDAAKADPSLYSLATGENANELHPRAQLQRLLRDEPMVSVPLGNVDPLGYGSLRTAIAEHLTKRGIIVSPEGLIVLSGSQQGLHLIAECLLEPGDAVAFEYPSYFYGVRSIAATGARVFDVPMTSHGLSLVHLESLLRRERIKLLFTIPHFHNPTTASMSADDMEQLLWLCEQHQVVIVEDDCYGELGFNGIVRPLKALDRNGSVIYLGSFSKTIAAGLRIGWAIAPSPVLLLMGKAKRNMDLGPSVLPQWLVSRLITTGAYDEHIMDLTRKLMSRRERLAQCLSDAALNLHDIEWEKPAGGCHIWCRLPVGISSLDLFDAARQAGVAIAPGGIYGVPEFGAQDGFRLSYCHLPVEEFAPAVASLSSAVKEQQGRTRRRVTLSVRRGSGR